MRIKLLKQILGFPAGSEHEVETVVYNGGYSDDCHLYEIALPDYRRHQVRCSCAEVISGNDPHQR